MDADEGSDSCDGLYPTNNGTDCPWQTVARVNSMTFQPGDTIAFEDTESWKDPTGGSDIDYLHPLGSGTSTAPITITDYCPTTGQVGGCTTPQPYPILNGNGAGSPEGQPAPVGGGTLYLDNQQYWNISHLEIQNTCPSPCPQLAYRQGILIQAQDFGVVNHISLQNLTVD